MQKKNPHPFYKVIASFMWLSAIPVVIALYVYLPSHWMEILGLSLSVWHVWSKILTKLRTMFISLAAYRASLHYDETNKNFTVVEQFNTKPEVTGVECETATVWALDPSL